MAGSAARLRPMTIFYLKDLRTVSSLCFSISYCDLNLGLPVALRIRIARWWRIVFSFVPGGRKKSVMGAALLVNNNLTTRNMSAHALRTRQKARRSEGKDVLVDGPLPPIGLRRKASK